MDTEQNGTERAGTMALLKLGRQAGSMLSKDWLSSFLLAELKSFFSALGPEQTPLHKRATPTGGSAHAEEEPDGCFSTQQLSPGEEMFLQVTFTQELSGPL